jgi:hypothetical protein
VPRFSHWQVQGKIQRTGGHMARPREVEKERGKKKSGGEAPRPGGGGGGAGVNWEE